MKQAQAMTRMLLLAIGISSIGGIINPAMAQQMFKWVGADGKVNYTDTPPPAGARQAESKAVGGTIDDRAGLPYELAQAARNHPVVLYTMPACAPCDSARSFLTRRGIPFHEKTVTTNADSERIKQAGGDGTMPMLLVGRAKQTGFENGAWGAMLSAAGYPETSRLPQGYRNPAPMAAAPVVEKIAPDAATPSAAPARPTLPPVTPASAAPAFRF